MAKPWNPPARSCWACGWRIRRRPPRTTTSLMERGRGSCTCCGGGFPRAGGAFSAGEIGGPAVGRLFRPVGLRHRYSVAEAELYGEGESGGAAPEWDRDAERRGRRLQRAGAGGDPVGAREDLDAMGADGGWSGDV